MPVLVSAIVPVYNDATRIGHALEALLDQSYPPDSLEIIVVNNRSTDETQMVVGEFERRSGGSVTLIHENEIQTSYAARNRGIGAARGEILAFTDSDCVPARDWVSAGVSALAGEDASCGGGRIEFIFLADKPNVFEYYDSARKLDQRTYVKKAGFAATANFFARRAVFDRFGLFNSGLVSGGDYEFGRRVTARGEKLVYIPEAVVRHPARSSFAQIRRKSKRVALGQSQLGRLGLLDPPPLRQLLPARTWPVDDRWEGSLSTTDKVTLLLMQSYLRWQNYLIRRR